MRVLLVDDDKTCNEFLALFLKDEGYEVRSALSAGEALAIAESFAPELVVADWLLKDGIDGAEMAHQLSARDPSLRVIFTTGSPSEQLREQIRGLRVVEVYQKPIEIDALLAQIRGLRAEAA
jgi:DNA-binding response OmpR family regulator